MARQRTSRKQFSSIDERKRSIAQGDSSLQPLKLHTMERKIRQLERILAQREQEVWTLKNLLLYH